MKCTLAPKMYINT